MNASLFCLLQARPNCLVFLDNDTVVVGGESPTAQMHSLIEKKMVRSWEAHTTRVRCMLMLGERKLVTASSSDNMIKIWTVSTDLMKEVEMVGSVDTTCRVTCMAVWHPGLRMGGKRKGEKVAEGGVVESLKKKIKLSETPTDKKVESITVEQEISTQEDKRVKKKKRKSGQDTAGQVAG